jgi:hypothetical protein
MDIGSIQQSGVRNSMSEDQKLAVEDILSKYDANNLSQSDAIEISSSFKELGIRPSSDLRQTIEDVGFDADSIREMSQTSEVSSIETRQGPPPRQSNENEESMISEILSGLLESDEDDTTASQSTQVMDYTSRIMNLNDEAKDSVKNLFEEFKPGNSDYSQDEVKSIVTSSLQSILSDENNYLHTDILA